MRRYSDDQGRYNGTRGGNPCSVRSVGNDGDLMINLDQRQKKFAEYYVGECNGNCYQAAIRAGYTEVFARSKSYLLLKNENIAAYIRELNAASDKSTIMTIEQIHTFLTDVINSDDTRTSEKLKAADILLKCKGAYRNDW